MCLPKYQFMKANTRYLNTNGWRQKNSHFFSTTISKMSRSWIHSDFWMMHNRIAYPAGKMKFEEKLRWRRQAFGWDKAGDTCTRCQIDDSRDLHPSIVRCDARRRRRRLMIKNSWDRNVRARRLVQRPIAFVDHLSDAEDMVEACKEKEDDTTRWPSTHSRRLHVPSLSIRFDSDSSLVRAFVCFSSSSSSSSLNPFFIFSRSQKCILFGVDLLVLRRSSAAKQAYEFCMKLLVFIIASSSSSLSSRPADHFCLESLPFDRLPSGYKSIAHLVSVNHSSFSLLGHSSSNTFALCVVCLFLRFRSIRHFSSLLSIVYRNRTQNAHLSLCLLVRGAFRRIRRCTPFVAGKCCCINVELIKMNSVGS